MSRSCVCAIPPVTLALIACSCAITKDDLRPPPEAVAELEMYGITIGNETEDGSFPNSFSSEVVAPEYVDKPGAMYPYVDITRTFNLYFSPDGNHDVLNDVDSNVTSRGTYPYEYSYSVETDGEFLEIPPIGADQPYFDDRTKPDGYLGAVDTQNCFFEQFILFGNYCLVDIIPIVPANATHIELWFQATQESERILVNRTALENLVAWRRYVKPLIEQNANEAK